MEEEPVAKRLVEARAVQLLQRAPSLMTTVSGCVEVVGAMTAAVARG
jgi:hypothetical protein